jgi:hypothetical protein
VIKNFIACGMAVTALGAAAQELDTDIKLQLETPYSRSTQSGISSVRGWSFHPTETVETVEIYIDGVFMSQVPVGGQRLDVSNAYPNNSDAKYSGWAQTVNFKELTPGNHVLEVVAFTADGDYNTREIEFCSNRFDLTFNGDPDAFNLAGTERMHLWNNRMIFEGVEAEGKKWNVEFTWSVALQELQISQITPYAVVDETTSYPCGTPQSFGITTDDDSVEFFVD